MSHTIGGNEGNSYPLFFIIYSMKYYFFILLFIVIFLLIYIYKSASIIDSQYNYVQDSLGVEKTKVFVLNRFSHIICFISDYNNFIDV